MSKVNIRVWSNKDKSYFIIRRHDKSSTLTPSHLYLTNDILQSPHRHRLNFTNSQHRFNTEFQAQLNHRCRKVDISKS